MDDNGHGTHCAGIIGAEGENNLGIAGVNWKVQIMPLKFMNAGGFGTTKDAIEAINYVIESKEGGRERSHHQRELGFNAEVARTWRRNSQSLRKRHFVRGGARQFQHKQRSHAALPVELESKRDERCCA